MRAKGLLLLMGIVLAVCTAAGCLAEARDIPDTRDWSPPDLTQATAETPELLILRVAQEEVGYVEGPRADQSKYGAWFGREITAWCAEFLTWCVNEADVRYGTSLLRQTYPYTGGPTTGSPFFIQKGRFVSSTGKLTTRERQWFLDTREYLTNDSYIPYAGDYMWFCYYNRTTTDHVAIVEGVSREPDGSILVHVIEGNNPDRVQRAVYPLTQKTIYGYGTPRKRVQTNMRVYGKGDDVETLQTWLIELGYYQAEKRFVGTFTKSVQKAVKAFQRDNGLKKSGVVDMETYLAILTRYEALTASPEAAQDATQEASQSAASE